MIVYGLTVRLMQKKSAKNAHAHTNSGKDISSARTIGVREHLQPYYKEH
jgi:hypothetical protein